MGAAGFDWLGRPVGRIHTVDSRVFQAVGQINCGRSDVCWDDGRMTSLTATSAQRSCRCSGWEYSSTILSGEMIPACGRMEHNHRKCRFGE
eukprot:scaffold648_cov247-Pinguiococcus_pyrenoidosus.AAC.2